MSEILPSPQVLQKELANKYESDIAKYAKDMANKIFVRINELTKSIDEAKALSKRAENAKSDWKNKFSLGMFGESATDKRSRLNTEVNHQQNEAMSEMNDLIQGCIVLTQCSILFAKHMVEEMSIIMVKGFKDKDGDTIRLSDSTKEQAQILLTQAQSGLERQRKIESNANEISQNKESISQNKSAISQNRQIIDENRKLIEQNQELIKKLEFKSSASGLYISILALLLAIINLCLHFNLF